MYSWQIALLVGVGVLMALALLRSEEAAGQNVLRFLLAWITPYVFVTAALCSLFLQGWPMALVFFAGAAGNYLCFQRRGVKR